MRRPTLQNANSPRNAIPRERFELLRAGGLLVVSGSKAASFHGLFSAPTGLYVDQVRTGEFKSLSRRVAGGNLLMVHTFQELIKLLDGIQVCPLKGIFLLDRIYQKDFGTRGCGDLDLLVRREDMAEISDLLLGWGMRAIESAPHHSCFVRKGLMVEMHTRLGYKHGLNSDWDAVAPIPGRVHDCEVFVLDDSTTLVHLLSHFVKHTPFTCLKWVEDLLRWETEGWDVEEVSAVARRIGAWRSVLAALGALRSVLGEKLLQPLGTEATIVERAAVKLHQKLLWPHLPDRPLAASSESTSWRRNLSALLLSDRFGHLFSTAATKGAELASRKKGGR